MPIEGRDTDCSCGSGESRYPIHDGYGIFLTYVCVRCQARRLKEFRPDVLERYDTDERIEPEE